jgi:NitT/TauT family transport system substrate-binding protein
MLRTSRRHHRRRIAAGLAGLAALCLALACAPPSGSAPARPADPSAASGSASVAAPTAPPLTRVRIAYAEPTPGQAPTWLAYHDGIFARHGLDVDLSFVASAQTVPAVIGGDIDVALGGGYAAMSARLAGSDLVIIYALTGWYPYELMAAPGIQSAADLRGQRIGISRFGSSSDVATRLAMRHLGLDPEQDVTYVQIGSLPERIAAMRAGAIAAGLAGAAETRGLRQMGFKSLLDLADLGEEAMINVGFASAGWIRANEAAAQGFVDGMVEAIHYAKTHREETQRMISQYVKIDDPAELDDAYDYYIVRNLKRLGHPSLAVGQQYLDSQVATDPRAVGAKVEDFFDLRFTQRTAASGLVERLYGGR